MATPVVFHLAVANTKVLTPGQLLSFLQGSAPDVKGFRRVPAFDGRPRADAFQWGFILGATGSVASIASLLWQAYDKYIGSQAESDKSAGIVIHVTPTPGQPVQFWIGGTHKDREQFVADFTSKVSQLQVLAPDAEYARAVDRLMSKPDFTPLADFSIEDKT